VQRHAANGSPNLTTQDVGAIRVCRQRVFELFDAGKLQAWTDVSHGFRGVEQVPDAIEYMLQGGHTGKVVIPL
jgi:NADPH-dependent curcumin reductase CurA